MNLPSEMLPVLIPLILLDLALAILALVHVLRHPSYRFGSKVLWVVVVLVIQLFGPIFYFVLGRGEDG